MGCKGKRYSPYHSLLGELHYESNPVRRITGGIKGWFVNVCSKYQHKVGRVPTRDNPKREEWSSTSLEIEGDSWSRQMLFNVDM